MAARNGHRVPPSSALRTVGAHGFAGGTDKALLAAQVCLIERELAVVQKRSAPPSSPRGLPRQLRQAGGTPIPSHVWGKPPASIDEAAPNGAAPYDPSSLEPFLADFVAEWQEGFEHDRSSYRSESLFLETKLRQALLLTVRLGLPNRNARAGSEPTQH